jgi:hypothetical protein
MTTKTKLDNWRPKAAEPATEKAKRTEERIMTIALRMPKKDWMRLKMLAMTEDVSLQALGMLGFDLVLKQKGQPPLG